MKKLILKLIPKFLKRWVIEEYAYEVATLSTTSPNVYGIKKKPKRKTKKK